MTVTLTRTQLGGSGEQVSALALGCMGMGTRADDETSFATLDAYAADGGNFLDTADCYAWFFARGTTGGQSEELLGRWLRRTGQRDDIFLATKGSGMSQDPQQDWPDGAQSPDWSKVRFAGAGAKTLRDALDGSLARLGTDRIDLYYIHVDDRSTALEETLEALAGFVTAGKIRYYGWSNVRTWRLERIRALCEVNGWPQPVALQQQHSYLAAPSRRDVSLVTPEQLDYLRDRDGQLSLVAYSPLAKGLYDLTETARDRGLASGGYPSSSAGPLKALDAVAAELGVKPGQVVLAWMAAQRSPRVIPLIGSTRADRYREASAAMDLQLTDEQVTRLNEA